jgi:ribonuclease HIII
MIKHKHLNSLILFKLTIVVVFTDVDIELLVPFLEKRKYTKLKIRTIHEQCRFSKGIKEKVLLILYNSKKLLLQGNSDVIEKTMRELHGAGIGKLVEQIHFRKELGDVIGSDESLKGDTFGGITVAAVKGNEEIRAKLLELGVADSKTLSDKEILRMAQEIKNIAPCHTISLDPKEYNRGEGVTSMLNQLHGKCAKTLKPGTHVVDKYPGCRVGDIMETKAEQKFVEVAAASILARAAAVEQINYLSKLARFPIPKGSTHVKWALEEMKLKRLNPREFVKLHFRNVAEFLEK